MLKLLFIYRNRLQISRLVFRQSIVMKENYKEDWDIAKEL